MENFMVIRWFNINGSKLEGSLMPTNSEWAVIYNGHALVKERS